MTIDQAYQLVKYIAQETRGGFVSPREFNNLAKQAQWEHCIAAYPPTDIKESNTLLPLQVTKQLSVTNGRATRPADFWHQTSMQYKMFINGQDPVVRPIDILNNGEFTSRLDSVIVSPTRRYPICTFYSDHIRIEPVGIGQVQFDYLKKPEDPYWDFDVENDRPVYKAKGQTISNNADAKNGPAALPRLSESQDFVLPEDTHTQIIMHMLQNIGINLDNATLTQFAIQKSGGDA